ncbi:hypothetical protein KAFR_0F01495 [Kazachstania africana CBS 2517]|uniref:Uncharacterized protein n=1 Tax=Kazachstania africana (strain ATCC 22294 / BCRC 22015 / CBS 2517 / CECT 1963 / NBRC 1671 / NRRL Y-8276) TaxID=1071382 RepID=H2AWJ6_KAZAF|nr:hypothetical protein KAFR_0F01495 [Kazachstania africana CBS 2517]CCF58746.1 hypothetical protein KAFR_0F01495 [Kazachstania africana CBS 2517]
MLNHSKYLFNIYLDLSLSIILGTSGYYLYEKRLNLPRRHTLISLLRNKEWYNRKDQNC